MKILRIITRLNIGGPAQHIILLSEGIEETLLCYGNLSNDEESILIQNNMTLKFLQLKKLIKVPDLQREINLIKDWKAFWGIRKLIKKYNPDIIHTHLAKAGLLGRLAGISVNLFQKKKIKLVHTFHGHTFHGYFSNWKTKMFLYLERWLGKRSTIICLSQAQRDDLIYKYKITTYHDSQIIPLGLELKKFRDLPLSVISEKLNIAIVGRLTPIKNHKLLLDAIRVLKDRDLMISYNFYIVGGGELKGELINYTNKLAINDCVIWWGWEADLAKFYQEQNIHLVLNTSLNEGTPVSLIEAVVAGRHVLCANFDGAREFLLEDTTNKWSLTVMVFDKTLKNLIDGLDYFYFSRGIKDEKIREDFYQKYSSDRLIKDMRNLYNDLLQ